MAPAAWSSSPRSVSRCCACCATARHKRRPSWTGPAARCTAPGPRGTQPNWWPVGRREVWRLGDWNSMASISCMVKSCWMLVVELRFFFWMCLLEDKPWNRGNTDVSLLGWPISLGTQSGTGGILLYERGWIQVWLRAIDWKIQNPNRAKHPDIAVQQLEGEGQSWRWCTELRAEKAGTPRGGLATEAIRTPKIYLCIHSYTYLSNSIYLSIYMKMVHQIGCRNLMVFSCR